MRAGALGVVLKGNATDELPPAVRKVRGGQLWFDRAMLRGLVEERPREARAEDPGRARLASLTRRELEIISLVGEGLRNRQIGERLFISEGTVKQHLAAVFGKLGVRDRFELIMYAYRHGLASPPLHRRAP